jgi:hypothetical protein
VCVNPSKNPEPKKCIYLFCQLQISHAINRYIRLGFDISEGANIENAIQGICGTSVAHLEPKRKKGIVRIKIKLYYCIILLRIVAI